MEKQMENVPPWETNSLLAVPVAEHLSLIVVAPVGAKNPHVTFTSQKPFFPNAMGGNAFVCVTLIFNGCWVFEGGRWVFAGKKAHKNVMIQEGIDFTSFKNLIKVKVGDGDKEWALSYVPKSKDGDHPIMIADDDDLEAFKFLNSKCGEHLWLMAIYVGPFLKENFSGDMGNYLGDMGICSGDKGKGEVGEVIGQSKEVSAMDISDKNIQSGDMGICLGDNGKGEVREAREDQLYTTRKMQLDICSKHMSFKKISDLIVRVVKDQLFNIGFKPMSFLG